MEGNCCHICIHWDETAIPQRGWGQCTIAKSVGGEPWQETKAYACDGEHHSAHLKTRADFACNQFKGHISVGAGPAEPIGIAMCGECFQIDCKIHPKKPAI